MKTKHSGELIRFFEGLRKRTKAGRELHEMWTDKIERQMQVAETWPTHSTKAHAFTAAEYLSRLQACYWDSVNHLCVAEHILDPNRRREAFPAFQTLRLLHNRFNRFGLEQGLFYVWPWNGYISPRITAVDIPAEQALITVRPFSPSVTFIRTRYTQLRELLASVA